MKTLEQLRREYISSRKEKCSILKFRYWSNTKNRYLTVEDMPIISSESEIKFHILEPYDDDVWEQFTGKTDNNGNELFDGDIILVGGKYKKLIRKTNNGFSFSLVNLESIQFEGVLDIDQTPNEDWWNDFNRDVKLMGNIHENKILFEKDE